MACQVRQPNSLPLLELPLEIRLRIYEFTFTESRVYVQVVGENLQDRHLHIHGEDVGILLTCRQIYHEVRSEWYTANLWTVGFPPALGYFLRSMSSEALVRVRHLTMQIHELPDLNIKLLPCLKMLVIDFSTDLPSFMTGSLIGYDDDKIYSRFADEAVARVHSTFKVLITELHEESRLFDLGLFAGICDYKHLRRNEIFVNLDTKLVQRREIVLSKIEEQHLCPEEKFINEKDLRTPSKLSTSEALGPDNYRQQSRHLRFRRCKFPPGRAGPFGEENKDERGSIRESEQEDSSSDSDEEVKSLNQVAKHVDWEDVKRIIEHPSEDEQSSESESEDKDVDKDEDKDEDEDEDEEIVSKPKRLKAEVERQPTRLILRSSRPVSPEPEQEQRVSSDVVVTEAKVQVPAVLVAGDQHRRVEEHVLYTTRWPESLSTPNPPLNAVSMAEATKPHQRTPDRRNGCVTSFKGFL